METVTNEVKGTIDSADSESEKDEYVDSGLPPPNPYIRRSFRSNLQFGVASMSRISSVPVMPTFNQSGIFDTTIEANTKAFENESAGVRPNPSPSISETDKFAERKKKLQSAAMTRSMPELRDVRALYNRGIGKSIRNQSLAMEELEETPKQTTTLEEDEVLDKLLAGL